MTAKQNILGESVILDNNKIITLKADNHVRYDIFLTNEQAKVEFNRICNVRRGNPVKNRIHKTPIAKVYYGQLIIG